MRKWYVNFRTRTGHTNTHWVEAASLHNAVAFAVAEYIKLHSISLSEGHLCVTDAGLKDA